MANNEKLQLALEKDLELVKKTADAALPSVDFTQEKVLELIGNLPIENGGTGAGTKKEAFNNLAFLGNNPISSTGGSGGSGGKYSRDDTAGYKGSSGGATSFGSLYTISGGGGGTGGWHTNSDGSINGNDGTSYGSPVKYNDYWYGNGGYGGSGYSSGSSGNSGIAIITLTDY